MKSKFSIGQKVRVRYQGQSYTATVQGYEEYYDEYVVTLDHNGQRIQVKAALVS